MKILIIEDDPVSLKLASEVLQAEGYVIMLAASADQAIRSVRAMKPDVILLDLRLPGIKGFGVARQLRDERETHDLPIIAVTAYSDEFNRSDAMESGCDAYLVKPINTRRLPQIIAEVVTARYSTVEAANG